MLQLYNHTPFLTDFSLLNDEHGVETLYVMVKATLEARQGWVVSDDPLPIWQCDEYYGSPGESALRYPSEQHLGKTATDIVVEGEARAPEGRPVTTQRVSVSVGVITHEVQVFGERVWDQGRISAPEPFIQMPLRYERSYGGSVKRNDRWLAYDERNPVGRFSRGHRTDTDMNGERLPNVERPGALVGSPDDSPEPIGLGAIAPHWLPRARHVGTYDQHWRQSRAPFAPEDFSRRFFNIASPGLVYPGWLQGGEPFRVAGMTVEGDWGGQVPRLGLSVKAMRGGEVKTLSPQLETLFLQPTHHRLGMTWRARMPCPKKVLDIEAVQVTVKR